MSVGVKHEHCPVNRPITHETSSRESRARIRDLQPPGPAADHIAPSWVTPSRSLRGLHCYTCASGSQARRHPHCKVPCTVGSLVRSPFRVHPEPTRGVLEATQPPPLPVPRSLLQPSVHPPRTARPTTVPPLVRSRRSICVPSQGCCESSVGPGTPPHCSRDERVGLGAHEGTHGQTDNADTHTPNLVDAKVAALWLEAAEKRERVLLLEAAPRHTISCNTSVHPARTCPRISRPLTRGLANWAETASACPHTRPGARRRSRPSARRRTRPSARRRQDRAPGAAQDRAPGGVQTGRRRRRPSARRRAHRAPGGAQDRAPGAAQDRAPGGAQDRAPGGGKTERPAAQDQAPRDRAQGVQRGSVRVCHEEYLIPKSSPRPFPTRTSVQHTVPEQNHEISDCMECMSGLMKKDCSKHDPMKDKRLSITYCRG